MTIARWWHREEQGQVACDLCPRACLLVEGQAGFCLVRRNHEGQLHTAVMDCTSGHCADPVEKKPLFHFLPGTDMLSFGSIGCNLGCVFCQNWGLSRAEDFKRLEPATPESIVRTALARRCKGVAFTYNEPAISAEFCLDVAQACREAGLATIAVTSGYITGKAREAFFEGMDAANVDLKGFSEDFYRRFCGARLGPVLDTLDYLAKETRVWMELTTLLIPEANDSPAELEALTSWIEEHLGSDVPLHFSAFHPDHRLLDRAPTDLATLERARATARGHDLNYVYLGNVRSTDGATTFCPGCGASVIERKGYGVTSMHMQGSACGVCGRPIPGVFLH